jgi:hypothetical protein
MCLLSGHRGRKLRGRNLPPAQPIPEGRWWWKFHAPCSINLLKHRNLGSFGKSVPESKESPKSFHSASTGCHDRQGQGCHIFVNRQGPDAEIVENMTNSPLTLLGYAALRLDA